MKRLGMFLAMCVCLHAETISVLIDDQVEEALIEMTGPYRLANPETEHFIRTGNFGRSDKITPSPEGLMWGNEPLHTSEVTFVALQTYAHSATLLDGVRYSGLVHVYQVGERLSIVNEIELEEYLKSLLSHHFPDPLHGEAMAAVTIAARTTTRDQIQRREGAKWHVRGEEIGFSGFISTQVNKKIEEALTDTRGMVLGSADFPALWTENCAGMTAPYHLMFGKNIPKELPGVKSSIAAREREHASWRVTVPKEWVSTLVGMSSLSGITLYTDPDSGKVHGMRVVYKGRGKDLDFFTLQEALGKDRLLSSDFTVELDGEQMIFTGYGKGHGVGLCLYSIEKMSDEGKNAKEMLARFFPNQEITLYYR